MRPPTQPDYTVVSLQDLEGLSIAETAQVLAISEGAVRGWINTEIPSIWSNPNRPCRHRFQSLSP